jgi:hypothetical protein
MPKSLSHKRGDAFEIKGFFLPESEEYCGGTEVLTVEDFVFGIGNKVFGSLGDVGLDVGEDVAAAAGVPCIFPGGQDL